MLFNSYFNSVSRRNKTGKNKNDLLFFDYTSLIINGFKHEIQPSTIISNFTRQPACILVFI